MKKELIIKKCSKCGALIKVINDCNCSDCGFNCCGESMITLKANESDASFEKHKPTYTKKDGKLIINVNHGMSPEHLIEWICLVTDNEEKYVYFNHEDTPTVTFDNVESGSIYAYCNIHGLWKEDIK